MLGALLGVDAHLRRESFVLVRRGAARPRAGDGAKAEAAGVNIDQTFGAAGENREAGAFEEGSPGSRVRSCVVVVEADEFLPRGRAFPGVCITRREVRLEAVAASNKSLEVADPAPEGVIVEAHHRRVPCLGGGRTTGRPCQSGGRVVQPVLDGRRARNLVADERPRPCLMVEDENVDVVSEEAEGEGGACRRGGLGGGGCQDPLRGLVAQVPDPSTLERRFAARVASGRRQGFAEVIPGVFDGACRSGSEVAVDGVVGVEDEFAHRVEGDVGVPGAGVLRPGLKKAGVEGGQGAQRLHR